MSKRIMKMSKTTTYLYGRRKKEAGGRGGRGRGREGEGIWMKCAKKEGGMTERSRREMNNSCGSGRIKKIMFFNIFQLILLF